MSGFNIKTLQRQFPHSGVLTWIGLRPTKKSALLEVQSVFADINEGLEGDHYSANSKKRQVTLFQQEDLVVLESLLKKTVSAEQLRRNLLVKGINLMAMKKQVFSIGEALFVATGVCHPCSRMEENLGNGGYKAMRSHCGITAQIVRSGHIHCGDHVAVLEN